jgi:hypothetical protein
MPAASRLFVERTISDVSGSFTALRAFSQNTCREVAGFESSEPFIFTLHFCLLIYPSGQIQTPLDGVPVRTRYVFSFLFSPVVATLRPLGWPLCVLNVCSCSQVPASAGRPCCCITANAAVVEQGLADSEISAEAVSRSGDKGGRCGSTRLPLIADAGANSIFETEAWGDG